MKTISLCMIVKNEEKNIEKCLSSLEDAFDEIIVVDTGSEDKTKDIVRKYTDKIYDFKWVNDFSKARNYSLSLATCDYCMWLDADDYIEKKEIDKIKKLKESKDDFDIYYFLYDFDPNYAPFYRERLFKNNKGFKFKGKIHEVISPFGKIGYESIIIKQQEINKGLTTRNLSIFESMSNDELTPRDCYYYARELYRHSKYEKAFEMFVKFLQFENIYIEDRIDSYYFLGLLSALKKEYQQALKYYFESFQFDLPRANILCEISRVYIDLKQYEKAIFYSDLALNKTSKNNKSFICNDYYNFIPSLQLCYCYDRLEKYSIANRFNELANKFKPNTKEYLFNKSYFEKKLAK